MTLFDYPKQAYFGRVLPKSKIYTHAGVGSRIKNLFVSQVDQIVWKYKLAPETINMPATKAVTEIQIFAISLKTGELHTDVLRSIDNAIPFPIVFELNFEEKLKVVACYKRPSDVSSEKWVIGNYFGGSWMPETTKRQALPVKLSLAALYDELLGSLIPYAAKSGETLQQRVRRAEAITQQERDLLKAEAALEKEKQFNRKVEINAKIRTMKQQIDTLKSPSGK